MSNQLPATTAKESAVAKPFDTLKKFLDSPEVKNAILKAAPKHLSADRQLRIVLTAALGQPKIAEACMTAAGKASIIKAMLTATQRGLELDGRQGHMVPFNDKRLGMTVQFIPGYQGLVDLAYNHPKVKSIWWNCVHDRDKFEFEDGLNRRMVHLKYDGDEDPGDLRFAYAVCEMDGGAKTFVCLNRREVMKAKASSKGADSPYSPWQMHEPAMWAKTAVRALCKQIPQSAELRDVLAIDDEVTRVEPTVAKAAVVEGGSFLEMPPVPVPEPKPEPSVNVGGDDDDVPYEEPVREKRPREAAAAVIREHEKAAAPKSAVNYVTEVRNLCKRSNINEANLLDYLRDQKKIDDSLSSIEEVATIAPAVLKDVFDNWSSNHLEALQAM